MIKTKEPISLSETEEYLKENTLFNNDLKGFIKKFNGLKKEDAKNLRKEIESLELIKIKSEQTVKIVDMLPETKEDLNKIITDVKLNEDEIGRVLEKIKKFK
jgi:DNA-directed RNA polymerase subunit F